MSKDTKGTVKDEDMLERLDELALAKLVSDREHESTIKVEPDELVEPDEVSSGRLK